MYVFCTLDARIYTLKQRRDDVRRSSSDQLRIEYLSSTRQRVNLLSPHHPRFERKVINE